jgi:hypothetical protein
VLLDLAIQELGEDVRRMDLVGAGEIAISERGVLRHHRRAQMREQMSELPHRFFHAHVGAGVAGAVVADEQELERSSRSMRNRMTPRIEARHLDQAADPAGEREVEAHAAAQRSAPAIRDRDM